LSIRTSDAAVERSYLPIFIRIEPG